MKYKKVKEWGRVKTSSCLSFDLFRYLATKWRLSLWNFSHFATNWRRLVLLPPWLFWPGEASHHTSFCLILHHRVITVGRPATASFASLNLDGSSSSPSPSPLTPAVPSNTTATACISTDTIVNQSTAKLHNTLPPGSVHPAMVPPSDPQLAAKWFACIWCRAGGCRPDWCEYRGWAHFATNIVMVCNLKLSVIRKS